ncbi:ATP-binding protein [Glutamicibacter creatinolyticus]|uniref:ATP-binding protein n=1 Tax=Glutamicibacter creatinolyticus TaxID=162496 RepID=UPI0031E1860D
MSEVGVIGRVSLVQSTIIRVSLDIGSKGFTKVGPDGLQTVGVVNSYITAPAGAHRVVAIVTGVSIIRGNGSESGRDLLSEDDQAEYELEAAVVGRFEGEKFRSGLTAYPSLHAPVRTATPIEVKNIFLPKDVLSLRLGSSVVAAEQDVYLDANLLLGHHCAVVGSTGSGKSCTVTALIDGLLDHDIPSGHIVIFDINGEYAKSFATDTPRGRKCRTLILGPEPGTQSGLFLPHWFMNNEEHLSLFRASEGVQAPVIQRAVADARLAGAYSAAEADSLENVRSTLAIIQSYFSNSMDGESPAYRQLHSLEELTKHQVVQGTLIQARWQNMEALVSKAMTSAALRDGQRYTPLTAKHRYFLSQFIAEMNSEIAGALGELGIGSASTGVDFDAPVYYDLQQLCDFFLPNRIQREQANDNRIGSYVATLQMRLSRLLADGRYDFMTRVEQHDDPLGSYLRLLMGEDPTSGNSGSDSPSEGIFRAQSQHHGSGPSVTIFDLSLVASDVLENVTSLLGRILFDFAVRSDPRAEHPMLLVLEEAHRFVPARSEASGTGTRSTAVFERIAKEGRKFGMSLLLASQRPSELSETVVAQCGTVIAHRLTHEADQALLRHATSLSSRALLDQLPGLAQQHALVTGVSTGVPAALRVREVTDPPKSNDPDFMESWTDPDRRTRLSAHIDKVVSPWQGSNMP